MRHSTISVVLLQRRRQVGVTLFEVVIALIVFSILLGSALERIYFYQGEAERAAVQLLVAHMRTALSSRQYGELVSGNRINNQALLRENPMSWLQRFPGNYGGEIVNSTLLNLTPGNWYFDTSQRKLVYVFSSKKSFLGDSFERWYFKVEFNRLPTNNAKQVGSPQIDGGVALNQVDSG